MTIVTGFATGYMRRVLATRSDAVMTGSARTNDLRVIDHIDRRPHIGVVAVLADIRCLNVRRVLAGSSHTVMAVTAVIYDVRVIEVGGEPANRRVAVITVDTARDVRRVLADRGDAVVTGAASPQHLRMVHSICGRPYVRVVTVLTDVRCLYVREVFAGRLDTVVATCTVADNIDMVEIGRQPADRRMAVVAITAAGDMSCVFASRRDAVMAGAANTQYLCVVHRSHRLKRDRVVAVFADITCLHVCRTLAGRGSAIMTADAVSKNVGVVVSCREPPSRIVTIFALIPG